MKMEKYYKMTNKSPAYIAALILNPNSKWKYIENNWKKEWVLSVRTMMDDLWEEYKPPSFLTPTTTATLGRSSQNAFSQWKKWH